MATKKSESSERSLENYLYSSDKARIYALVQQMTIGAREALAKAVAGLRTLDVGAEEDVVCGDDAIDELEEQIDQECLYSIAMRQPMREDLRYVYAVMKIITDIERIGDQAVNVAERLKEYVNDYHGRAPLPKIDDLLDVSRRCSEMIDDFLGALDKEDGGVLAVIREKRRETVRICRKCAESLMQRLSSPYLSETPAEIFIAIDLFRHLKRVADHLMNLGEKVYFIATGVSPLTLKRELVSRGCSHEDSHPTESAK